MNIAILISSLLIAVNCYAVRVQSSPNAAGLPLIPNSVTASGDISASNVAATYGVSAATGVFTGAVGIGRTDPRAMVHLSSGATGNVSFRIDGDAGTAMAIESNVASALIRFKNVPYNQEYRFKIESDDNFQIRDATNSQERLVLTSAGLFAFNPFQVGTATITAAGAFVPRGYTEAEIRALDPVYAGEMYYCSDCETSAMCVSTGTALGAWADIGDRTAICD